MVGQNDVNHGAQVASVEDQIRAKTQDIIDKYLPLAEDGSKAAAKKVAQARELAEAWCHKNFGDRGVTAELREFVLASGPCAYCCFISPSIVDHIIPVSLGGPSKIANLAPSCNPCNQEKRDRTPAQWRADRLAHGLCWPPLQPGELVSASLRQVLERGMPDWLAGIYVELEPAEARPTRYEDDPRWQAANVALMADDGNRTEFQNYMRLTAAIERVYQIELEYEPRPRLPACRVCMDSGRAVIDGIDRHCTCPTGRAMARAHWADKALEEAWA